MSVTIRHTRLPEERGHLAGYIHKLQLFEAAFEADRRTDEEIAFLYFDELIERALTKQGRIFVAETPGTGAVIGWAVCHTSEQHIFVKEEDRRFGYIAELFVEEGHRGLHIGRRLIEACEAHFRNLGLTNVMIGALAGNARAIRAYQAAGYAPYSMELRKRL